jgi:sugar lactone lactonase YvrE
MQFQETVRGVYLEGLCADEDSAWVSDPIKGGIRRWQPGVPVTGWLPDKRWVGSLLLNDDDVVLVSGEGGIIWLDGNSGATGVVLDQVNGQPISGINEMVADRRGNLYFGSLDVASIAAGRQTVPASIYRRDADGRVTQLLDGLRFSNGIALSPDEKYLYHNETFVGTSGYPIATDGTLGERAFFFDKPDCDGLVVDAQGTLWLTGFETKALTCLGPDGKFKRELPIPNGGASSLRFGGADMRDLYITTVPSGTAQKLAQGIWPTSDDSILYRTRSDATGFAVPPPRIRLS